MKNVPIKPLLILVLCIGAGLAQAHAVRAGQTYGVPVLADMALPLPSAYPIERHSYADVPEAVPAATAEPTAAVTQVSVVVPTPTPASTPALPTQPKKRSAAVPAAKASSAPVVPAGYHAVGGQLYAGNGQRIVLRGVNWFGFETDNYTVHGLWQRNWQDMIKQIKDTGFNAVRLPICPASLSGMTVSAVDYGLNPDLKGQNSQQLMDTIVRGLSAQGIYVLIDMHNPDCQSISDLWYTSAYSEANWIADLQKLATRYASVPNFIGIDLKNEPHGAATWGTGNQATDWNLAADRAGAAVLAANPNLLVFVEGIQDSATCSSTMPHFAGINFEPANCVPLQLPVAKTVYSPHVYGPDVWAQSYFSDPAFPNNLPAIWDTQFGFLKTQGKTVVPGEWGGKYGTDGGKAQDVALQDALTAYYASHGICSSFYWSWNPNSGDTGGILGVNGENDWQNVWPTKLALLQKYWNACQ